MQKTYEAYLHNDRLKWLKEKPPHHFKSKDIHVHVTILDTPPMEETEKKNTLVEFFRESPLFDSGIDLERRFLKVGAIHESHN